MKITAILQQKLHGKQDMYNMKKLLNKINKLDIKVWVAAGIVLAAIVIFSAALLSNVNLDDSNNDESLSHKIETESVLENTQET